MKNKQIFNISATAEELVPDKMGRTSYMITLLIAFIMTSIITLLLRRLPVTIPLFFTLPWGDSRLAPQLFLYILPAITIVLVVINLGLGRIAAKLSPLLPKVLAVTTMVVAAMFLIALVGIIQSLVL